MVNLPSLPLRFLGVPPILARVADNALPRRSDRRRGRRSAIEVVGAHRRPLPTSGPRIWEGDLGRRPWTCWDNARMPSPPTLVSPPRRRPAADRPRNSGRALSPGRRRLGRPPVEPTSTGNACGSRSSGLIHLTDHAVVPGVVADSPTPRRRRCAAYRRTSVPMTSPHRRRRGGDATMTSRRSSISSRSASPLLLARQPIRPPNSSTWLHFRGCQQPRLRPHGPRCHHPGLAPRANALLAQLGRWPRPSGRPPRPHARPARHPDDDGRNSLSLLLAPLGRQLLRQVEGAEFLGKFNGATGTWRAPRCGSRRRLAGDQSRLRHRAGPRLGIPDDPDLSPTTGRRAVPISRRAIASPCLCNDVWTYISLGYFRPGPRAGDGQVEHDAAPKVSPIRFREMPGQSRVSSALLDVLATTWSPPVFSATSPTPRCNATSVRRSALSSPSTTSGGVCPPTLAPDLGRRPRRRWEVLAEPIQSAMRALAAHQGVAGMDTPRERLKELDSRPPASAPTTCVHSSTGSAFPRTSPGGWDSHAGDLCRPRPVPRRPPRSGLIRPDGGESSA